MEIVIVRHATAEDKARSDEDRRLTREGRQEAASTAQALLALGVKPDKILTSPLVRAMETADILSRELGNVDVEVMELLAPPGDPKEAMSDLETLDRKGVGSVVLVGHNPSLEEYVGYFICSNTAARISLCKAGAAGLSYDPRQQAQPVLEWLLKRKQLKIIAGK